MWHFKDKDFEDRDEEELVDVSRPSHWARIVRNYNLVGNDD